LEDLFCTFIFLLVHPYFYPVHNGFFIRPNDGLMGLCIKLCDYVQVYSLITYYRLLKKIISTIIHNILACLTCYSDLCH